MNKKILASLFAVGLAAGCVCSSVDAHGVFFANRLDEKALVLGEGPVDDADYTDRRYEGFYAFMNAEKDFVYLISSVGGPYKVIPHFEILGK